MANETTLESLRIEVNANSQMAMGGISALIGSLRHLAKATATALAPLRQINHELKEMSKYGVINIPNLTGGNTINTSAFNSQTKAIADRTAAVAKSAATIERFKNFTPEQWKVWRASDEAITQSYKEYTPEKEAIYGPWFYGPGRFGVRSESYASREEHERLGAENMEAALERQESILAARAVSQASIPDAVPATSKAITETANAANTAQQAVTQVNTAIQSTGNASRIATTNLTGLDRELRRKGQDGKTAKKGLDEAANGARNLSRAASEGTRNTASFGRAIGRMARTMLIRTALRAIMKAFSESWTAAYEFSKSMDGTFARSIDTMRGAFASVSLTMIQTFAPVLEAIVPIVVVVANAINYLCSAIQSLLTLLGMTSDLLGASVSQMDKFRKASGGGGGKKGQLAKFDELNVIQSSSGGGSGGGGSGLGLFETVSAEIDAITAMLVGEGLIALGLIMACTGHIPLGIGMIAVGAASLYGVAVNWSELPEQVKKTVTDIGYTAGAIMFGAGLILACAGHPVAGIGMMVAGAASVAGVTALNWSTLPEKSKKSIMDIGFIAGAVLFGVGVVLACAGHPLLGIGMMVAGAAAVAGILAVNWNKLPENTKKSIISIGFTAGQIMFGAGLILTLAGHPVAGIGLMVAGAGAVAAAAAVNNKTIPENVQKQLAILGTLTAIGLVATGLIVSLFCPGHLGVGIGLLIAGMAAITAVTINWDKLPNTVKSTITKVGTITTIGMMAVGLIIGLLCPAHVGVGIALMVAGAIGYYGMSALSTDGGNGVTSNVKSTLGEISAIAGVTLFEIGLILSLVSPAHLGLGIAMMVSGIAIAAAAVNWSGTTSQVAKTLSSILFIAGTLQVAVGLILALSGANIPLGIGLIVAGGVAIGSAVALDWSSLKEKAEGIIKSLQKTFTEKWGQIEDSIRKALEPLNEFIARLLEALGLLDKTKGSGIHTGSSGDTHGGGGGKSFGFSLSNIVTPKASFIKPATSVPKRAEGGFVREGDLFIANERGAELIGSMNSKTAVANQGQIIEGIQRGVSDANAEQNALLRQQNDLLQRILEKDASVRIGASSALGRIVTQSQQMYAKQVGG